MIVTNQQTPLELFVEAQHWIDGKASVYRCSICQQCFELSRGECEAFAASRSSFDFHASAPCGHGWKRLELVPLNLASAKETE
jgi:hypothetical protein